MSHVGQVIEPFFSTMQWVMAGNDTEGLRYGAPSRTPEKYCLSWVEDTGEFAAEPFWIGMWSRFASSPACQN